MRYDDDEEFFEEDELNFKYIYGDFSFAVYKMRALVIPCDGDNAIKHRVFTFLFKFKSRWQQNIELVVSQTGVDRKRAEDELQITNGDVVDAIMNLTI